MQFTIMTPSKKQTHLVNWVEINTPKGNFVIQPGHAPMIIALSKKKPVTFGLKNGKRESIVILEGIISIDREHATIIASQDL